MFTNPLIVSGFVDFAGMQNKLIYGIIRNGTSPAPFYCPSVSFYNTFSEIGGVLFFCPQAAGAPKPCKEGLWA